MSSCRATDAKERELNGDQEVRLGRWQDTLASIPDGSVRLILTSPPYDNARTYEGTCEPVDFDELAAFFLRVLCPGGVVAMVLDGAVNDGALSTTPYEVICSWAKMPGWRLLQVLAYGRQGAPGAYKGRFRRDHEPLIVMVKDGAPHVCEKVRIAKPAKVGRCAGFTVRCADGSRRGQTSVREDAFDVQHRGSFWNYGITGHGHDPSADTGHPATFAEAFALDAVNVWSNPGELVVDPFAGSCTVGRACQILGRRFIGSERVEKYHEIGLRRLRDPEACERAALAEAEAVGQTSLFGGRS